MTLPNFLVIGAAKAGTTSLHAYLRQHPDVFMPERKALRFFSFEGTDARFKTPSREGLLSEIAVTQIGDYEAHFADAGSARAIGEATPLYLSVPGTVARIHRRLPEVRLIAILRNPVDGAYSAYLHQRRDGAESCTTFAEALAAEEARVADGWWHGYRYRYLGLYARHLAEYDALFDRAQIRIHLYEDLQQRPRDVIADLFGFLGVDAGFEPAMEVRLQATGIPRSTTALRFARKESMARSIYRALVPQRYRRRLTTRYERAMMRRPALDPAIRAELTAYFRDDILRLQDRLQRDLGSWLAD